MSNEVRPPQPATEREPERDVGETLNPFVALWYALRNKEVGYFPRIDDQTVESGTVVGDTLKSIENLKLGDDVSADDRKEALTRARESLNEVKALTEYQDQKATRLLTIITFLTALAGVLFGKLVDTAAPNELISANWCDWESFLLALCYAMFIVYILAVISGAMLTFKATETRFKYPKGKKQKPRSYIFYDGMLTVSPSDWGKSFLKSDNLTKLNPNLQLEYLRNYISESYLIAAKVADKLRYLGPAQWYLQWAIRILFGWILVFALTLLVFAPPAAPPTGVAQTEVVGDDVERLPTPHGTETIATEVDGAPAQSTGAATTTPAPVFETDRGE